MPQTDKSRLLRDGHNSSRSTRKGAKEWNEIRKPFESLYIDIDMPLREVMAHLHKKFGFQASENQWKFRIKKWRIDKKKIKTSEMKHMIKIQDRRLQGNPPKTTRFALNQKPVDSAKIERYRSEHDLISIPSSATLSSISWVSPPQTIQAGVEDEVDKRIQWIQDGCGNAALPLGLEGIQGINGEDRYDGTPPFGSETGKSLEDASTPQSLHHTNPQPLIHDLECSPDNQRKHIDKASESSCRAFSPMCDAFHWWPDYYACSVRQSSPKLSRSPLLDIFEVSIIAGDTFEDEMFNRAKRQEHDISRIEVQDRFLAQYGTSAIWASECPRTRCQGTARLRQEGVLPNYDHRQPSCAYCELVALVMTYRLSAKAYVDGNPWITYRPNHRWIFSEALKIISRSKEGCASAMTVIWTLMAPSSQASQEIGHQRLCRSLNAYFEPTIKREGFSSGPYVLNLQIFLIDGDCAAAMEFLDVSLKNQPRLSDLLEQQDANAFEALPLHTTGVVRPELLTRRFIVASRNLFKWFARHDIARNRVFGGSVSTFYITRCFGVIIRDYHFCFSGRCWSAFDQSPNRITCCEDLNVFELQFASESFVLTRDFCQIAAQSLWRFLQRYGHLLETTDPVPAGKTRRIEEIEE